MSVVIWSTVRVFRGSFQYAPSCSSQRSSSCIVYVRHFVSESLCKCPRRFLVAPWVLQSFNSLAPRALQYMTIVYNYHVGRMLKILISSTAGKLLSSMTVAMAWHKSRHASSRIWMTIESWLSIAVLRSNKWLQYGLSNTPSKRSLKHTYWSNYFLPVLLV